MIKNMKGISLIEALLVIAIAAAMIMAAVRYFRLTSRSVHVAHAIQQVQTLTKASYEWLEGQKQDDFSSMNGGTAISMTQLIQAGLIRNTKTNTKDPWAGEIKIEPGSDPTRVKITLANIPQKACKNLARRLDTISQTTMPHCHGTINQYTGEF